MFEICVENLTNLVLCGRQKWINYRSKITIFYLQVYFDLGDPEQWKLLAVQQWTQLRVGPTTLPSGTATCRADHSPHRYSYLSGRPLSPQVQQRAGPTTLPTGTATCRADHSPHRYSYVPDRPISPQVQLRVGPTTLPAGIAMCRADCSPHRYSNVPD